MIKKLESETFAASFWMFCMRGVMLFLVSISTLSAEYLMRDKASAIGLKNSILIEIVFINNQEICTEQAYPDCMSMPILASFLLILLISVSKLFNFALKTSSVTSAPTFNTMLAPETAREKTLNITDKQTRRVKMIAELINICSFVFIFIPFLSVQPIKWALKVLFSLSYCIFAINRIVVCFLGVIVFLFLKTFL